MENPHNAVDSIDLSTEQQNDQNTTQKEDLEATTSNTESNTENIVIPISPEIKQEPATPLNEEQQAAHIELWTEALPIPQSLESMTKADLKKLLSKVAKNREEKAKNESKETFNYQSQRKDTPFKYLGYDLGIYYLISLNQLQVLSLKASELSPNNLLQLADLGWWEDQYPIISQETGEVLRVDWPRAVNDIIQNCSQAGVYHPEAIKGRGFWFDGDIVLRHIGNKLININSNAEIPFLEPSLNGIYQKSKAIDIPDVEIATRQQIQKFYETVKTIYWTNKTSPMLLIGWAALAPMCGLLNWRPHIWITGEAGSGKSDTVSEALVTAIGKIQLLHAKDSTTEAGLRQTLKADAIPILLDEMEPNSAKDRARIDRLVSLARNSSSDDEAVTLKGTVSGDSTSYRIRSMFCYASINTHLPELADQSRTSVLSIEKRPQTTQSKEDFALIKRNLMELDSANFGYALTNYMSQHIEVLKQNIAVCVEAAGDALGSGRDGKQYGTLIAGYITMMKGETISKEQASAYIEKIELNKNIEEDRDTQATGWGECWGKMANIRLELRDSNSRITVGESLEMLQQNNLSDLAKIVGLDTNNTPIEDDQTALKSVAKKGQKEVTQALRRLGIIYQDGTESLYGCTGEGIYLANKSELLKKALNGTAFEDWNQYSKRVGESTTNNINMANGRPRARFIKNKDINL